MTKLSVKGIPGPIHSNGDVLPDLPFDLRPGLELRRQFKPIHEYTVVGESEHSGYWIVKLKSNDELRVFSIVDFDSLGCRVYEPNGITHPYTGKISADDIQIIKDALSEEFSTQLINSINEKIVREAISANNWNNEWGPIIERFPISGDTCNREAVTRWVQDILCTRNQLKSQCTR